MSDDPRECGWLCGHPKCEPVCAGVSLKEWREWNDLAARDAAAPLAQADIAELAAVWRLADGPEVHEDRLMCQAESREDCDVDSHWLPDRG